MGAAHGHRPRWATSSASLLLRTVTAERGSEGRRKRVMMPLSRRLRVLLIAEHHEKPSAVTPGRGNPRRRSGPGRGCPPADGIPAHFSKCAVMGNEMVAGRGALLEVCRGG